MSPTGRKLVIISMDAMVREDLEYAKTLPTWGYMLEHGALVEDIREIYPTLTYPTHQSMISGMYPDKHGVINNIQFVPGTLTTPWNWYHDVVKRPDLMDIAKKNGLLTASVSWPVSGRHPSIDLLVDEIWPLDVNAEADVYVSTFLGSGTSPELMEAVVQPYVELRMKRKQPGTSWFSTSCAADIIRSYSPDIISVHLTVIDGYRHDSGVFNDHVKEGIRESEEMLRTIVEAVKFSGFLDITDLCIVSDHGQIDIDRVCCPNVLFRKAGLIETDKDGNVTRQKVYAFPTGCSCQIVLDDPKDWETYAKVQKILNDARESGKYGIERVYTKEEAEKEENLSGGFAFILEGDGHTCFSLDWHGEKAVGPTKYKANHGHHPDKGPDPFFLGFGPDFKEGVRLPGARIIDEAPTYAKILGLTIPEADGKAIEGMLR